MIAFPFEYIQADTIDEAVSVYSELQAQGKKPLYFSGGTEIITMGRVNNIKFDAAIDIKKIPECNVNEVNNGKILLGAGLSLKQVCLAGLFPLLCKTAARIADHTAQVKITLGGNIAGTIIYHEAALPLLLADADVLLAGPDGRRTVKLAQLYMPMLQLNPGEMIVQFSMDEFFAKMPYAHAKHTEGEKIGYPLVTICALQKDKTIKAAVAGIQTYPVLLDQVQIDHVQLDLSAISDRMLAKVPRPLLADTLASAEYRQKLLRESVLNLLERLIASK